MLRSAVWPLAAAGLAAGLFLGAAPAAAQATGIANPCPINVPQLGGGGASNIVVVHNATGGDLRIRGKVQLNRIPGPTVSPTNCAAVFNGGALLDPLLDQTACVGCQTFAIALQIDLIGTDVRRFAPVNFASARNIRCDQCLAVAVAMQFVRQVDDPTQLPPDLDELVRQMDRELIDLQSNHSLTPQQAADQAIDVVQQFKQLTDQLDVQRNDAV